MEKILCMLLIPLDKIEGSPHIKPGFALVLSFLTACSIHFFLKQVAELELVPLCKLDEVLKP